MIKKKLLLPILLVVLAVGCRHTQPNTTPPSQAVVTVATLLVQVLSLPVAYARRLQHLRDRRGLADCC